jgi:hypothetical protein
MFKLRIYQAISSGMRTFNSSSIVLNRTKLSVTNPTTLSCFLLSKMSIHKLTCSEEAVLNVLNRQVASTIFIYPLKILFSFTDICRIAQEISTASLQ